MSRPSRRSDRFAVLSSLLLAAALLPAASRAAEPWEGRAFAADPAAVLRAAQAVPGTEGEAVVVLFLDASYSYDSAGRETFSQRIVYRIVGQGAHESWSAVEERWSPWHQARPELRARVITPDGAVHLLDPAVLSENGEAQEAPDMFEDGRVLRGPLPAVRPGAVVEQEVKIRDTAPFFDRGVVRYQALDMGVTVRRARVTLEAPESLALRWAVRGLAGAAPVESVVDGRRRILFEARDVPAQIEPEPGLPPEVPRSAYLAFSTGRSWGDVARTYSEIVDGAIQGSDLRSFVKSAGGPAASQLETINLYLARLGEEIRYTGVELGEGGLIPRKPSETLRRKFGDCKDKAVLLTAMLRASEIPAYVALLSAGEDEPDVEEGLPGLGGFNHAIVIVPGNPAIWIDPTDPFARAGELPVQDQGRLALVASPNAGALVRTPEATSAENREVETREYYLAELGKARVVETTEYYGETERELRAYYAMADGKELRAFLEEYAATAYLAGRLSKMEHSDPVDLSRPLTLRLEAEQAGRGMTDVRDAAVAVQPGALLARLPDELSYLDDEREGPRTAEYMFSRPFRVEARYRVVPPDGFVPQPLPASRVRRFGPVVLSEEYAAGEGGVVTASLSLDVSRRRLSAREFEEVRQGVLALAEEKPVLLLFEQVGETHLGAGRVREALEELGRLAARSPKSALPRTRIARALLAGGMGEAAREEAERAVKLEPRLAPAWRDLGWILQHDELGRRFGPGFDRAGAVAAYRKARELDPEDWVTRADLAILLEHNARGQRYGTGAELGAAIDEYQALRKDLGQDTLDDNLLIALLRAERFAEVRDLAATLPPTESRTVLALVATAALDGPETALRDGERKFQDERTRIAALSSAAQTLMALRRYPAAAALLERASRQAPNAAALLSAADVVRRARRREELTFSAKDPANAARQLLEPFLSDPFDSGKFFSLFTRSTRVRMESEGRKGEPGIESALLTVRKAVKGNDLSLQSAMEIGLAAFRETVTGDDTVGYRVRLDAATEGSFRLVAYVVLEDGQYRIAGLHTTPQILGAEALRRAGTGDLRGARRWLDWAAEEMDASRGEDPLAGKPFSLLWARGREAAEAEVRCAAAALLTEGGSAAVGDAIPQLLACREAAEGDTRRKSAFDLALAQAYLGSSRHAELQETARRLATENPGSDRAFALETLSLTSLGQWDGLRKIAEERLDRSPGDPQALRTLADLAEQKGDLDTAERLLLTVVDAGKAGAPDFNDLAWLALVRGRVDDRAIENGQRAATLSGYKDASSLHTLAALYADQGKTAEAYRLLLQSLQAKADEKPEPHDWYVLGQLAERYGLPDTARRYYERVTPPRWRETEAISTYKLALRRLEALGGKNARQAKTAKP